jgi:HEAT repeat protein
MGGRWRPASAQVDPAHIAPPPDWSHRWRHPGLEMLMAQPVEKRPDLHLALQSTDPVVATNAAILLSRQHEPAAFEPLLRAARSNEANSWLRRAAIEALAGSEQPSVVAELRALVDAFGKFDGAAARLYQPDLHVELLHGLAHAESAERSAPLGADGEPRFAAALASPAATVRREALVALADPHSGPLPANIVRHVGDRGASVRRAALHLLAVRRHPEALELLRQALLDQDLIVRLSAVADLGQLGGPEAIAQLRQLAGQGTEMVRAAAVAAIVALGDDQIASTAMNDKSWRVRRALVPILDRRQTTPPTELAEQLVADINADVAQAAIDSIGRWPLAKVGPVLLTAMDGRSYLTRKAAAEQLSKLWPPASEFETEAAAPRRASQMEQLRRKWQADGAVSAASAVVAVAAADGNSPPAASAGGIAPVETELVEVRRLLAQLDGPTTVAERANAIHALVAFGPELPGLLRRITENSGRPLPADVYSDALPAVSPEFAAIQRLTSADVRERRRAADALKGQTIRSNTAAAPHMPLGALALERLVDLTIREPDPLVWSSILSALADDDREPATRLAYAALGHPEPEVRREACEHLATHPDPRHAPLLAKSLADADPTVVEAAVRAIGRLPSLDDPRPLENILAADDHALRVEAAESLARFGFISGVAALERLGYDAAPKIRRLAATAMGRAADRSFVPVLIRLLDDRPEIAKAALESLPRAAGRDLPPAHSLAADSLAPSALPDSQQSQIQRWKDWYATPGAGQSPR